MLEFAFNDYYAGLNITGPERAAYERVRPLGRWPRANAFPGPDQTGIALCMWHPARTCHIRKAIAYF